MLSRRNFFQRVAMFISGGIAGSATNRASAQNSGIVITDADTTAATEPAAPMPVDYAAAIVEGSIAKTYDLVIIGGGIAGVSAAISAARNGLKVALVHNRAMFGGNSSSEVKLYPENNSSQKPWIKEGGLNEEFHIEERVRNHEYYREGSMNCHWDLVLYEWVIREKNITPYLNTHMHRVFMKSPVEIESVFCIQLGTEKSFTLSAPLFVDASGDGVLGGQAKADHRWGREAHSEYNEPLAPAQADERLMGNTLFFTAKDTGAPAPFKRPDWAVEFPTENALASRYHGYYKGGYWWIEIGAPYHPIADNNQIAHELLRQTLGVWDHIKNQDCTKVDRAEIENYGLDFVGFWPYKREARRIIGDYVLTQHDVQNPQDHPDDVAYGAWNMDVHVNGGVLRRDVEPYPDPNDAENWQDISTMVYNIPIRSLYSRNISNLMMAGRPISASYLAFASTRVLCTGSIVGQAVGAVAALAKQYGAKPREVAAKHASAVQQILLRQDCHIPGVENTDEADLARKAKVTASSEMKLQFPDGDSQRDLKFPHAQLFPVTADRIDFIELKMHSKRNKPTKIRVGLREAPRVWDFRSEKDLASAEATLEPKSDGWVRFDLQAKVEPGKLYYIYTNEAKDVIWYAARDKQGQPSLCPVGTTPAVLPPKSNYADKSKTFRENFPDVQLKDIPGAGKFGHWKCKTGGMSMCMRVSPEITPYSAQNIVRGTNRPDKWTNIWISNPAQKLPASVELTWNEPVEFSQVQLTFDTNQNVRCNLPYFRYPDCAKNYMLEYDDGSGWKKLAEVTDNYMRRRVHNFDKMKTKKLRATITATNGGPTGRLYEVRVY